MKRIKGAGTILFLAAFAVSQTAGLASAKVSTVDAEELFHSKQLIEDPSQQNKLDTSQAEDVRAIAIDRARLHWDAVDKTTASSVKKEKTVTKAVPVIITAADIDGERKKQKEHGERKEIPSSQPERPALQPMPPAPVQEPVVLPAPVQEVTQKPVVVPIKQQEDSIELPPIQPVQLVVQPLQETAAPSADTAPRIVELPPIEQISVSVSASSADAVEQVVELPPVQSVR